MDFDEVLRRRRMTRRFRPDPVPAAVLDEVLAAALRAPSAGFTQGVDLLVLTDAAARATFWELASDRAWRERGGGAADLLAAPAIVLPVGDAAAYTGRYGEADKASTLLHGLGAEEWPVPYWLVDSSFSTMLLLAAATSHGLGALFFQLHAPAARILAGLGIPAGRELIGAIALGYPAGDERATSPSRRSRRPFDEVVHRDRW